MELPGHELVHATVVTGSFLFSNLHRLNINWELFHMISWPGYFAAGCDGFWYRVWIASRHASVNAASAFRDVLDSSLWLFRGLEDWIAVKELNLSCYIGETVLMPVYIYIYIYIYIYTYTHIYKPTLGT